MMKKRLMIGAVIGSVILGGALIVGANDSLSVETNKGVISFEEAEEKALTKVDGKVDGVELKKKNGNIVYEVEIEKDDDDVDVYVDGNTGEIVAVKNDDDDDKSYTSNSNKNVISPEEAVKIAQKSVKGKFHKIEKEHDDGRIKYEVELKTSKGEVEIEVDGITGQIIEIDYED